MLLKCKYDLRSLDSLPSKSHNTRFERVAFKFAFLKFRTLDPKFTLTPGLSIEGKIQYYIPTSYTRI